MKKLPTLIFISLALNVGLVVCLLFQRAVTVENARQEAEVAAATAKREAFRKIERERAVAKASAKTQWANLNSDDFEELFQRLRAAGFTPWEIRTIMAQKIAEKYPSRLMTARNGLPYWRSPFREFSEPKNREEDSKRNTEEQRLYWKYVYAPDDALVTSDFNRLRFGDLSTEKMRAMLELEREYTAIIVQRTSGLATGPSADENKYWEAYRSIEKERLAEVARLLTPDEFAAYELRSSRAAAMVHSLAETFRPSEEEYKTLYAITKPFEEKINSVDLISPLERESILQQIKGQVAAALGPERAEDFIESALHGSDKMARLIARLDLPARTAITIRNFQQDLTLRAAEVRDNKQLLAEDRAAGLNALAQIARTQLTAVLGEQGFEAYDDMKGDWIRGLQKTK